MAFGVGFSDIVKAIELCNEVRKRFVDSPAQFSAISEEVKSLSNVLRDLDDLLPKRELNEQQEKDVKSCAISCLNVLKELNEKIRHYGLLDAAPRKVGAKAKRTWKKLTWDHEDIKDLRSRLVSNIGLLNAVNTGLLGRTTLATKVGVDRLNKYQDDQERRKILRWLSSANSVTVHSDMIRERQENTGKWLLESREFKKWLSLRGEMLICPGVPGTGKTVLASIIIDSLFNMFGNRDDVGIAFLYCNYKKQHEQSLPELMAILLQHLIQSRPVLPESVKTLYSYHTNRGSQPTIEELRDTIHSVGSGYTQLYIVVDAIDECTKGNGTRTLLIDELYKLQKQIGANVLATSRFIPDITSSFKGVPSLEIRASEDDIRLFVRGCIDQLPKFVQGSRILQEEIEDEIVKAVDGMFILAKLHADSLKCKLNRRVLRLALEGLPKGSNATDTAYQAVLERIDDQPADLRELAKRVLSWIICAQRQLSVLELQHALAIMDTDTMLDTNNMFDPEDMVSVCAGIVIIDHDSNTIRLVHYTTQEYFERIQPTWLPDADGNITDTCLTYLSFDTFKTGACRDDIEFDSRLRENPFLEYAAKYWGIHAYNASFSTWERFLPIFFEDECKRSCAAQILLYLNRFCTPGTSVTGLHLAAYFDLVKLARWVIQRGKAPDMKDGQSEPPLETVSGKANKLPSENHSVLINLQDYRGRTALSYAAEQESSLVIQLLLRKKNIKPDRRDFRGMTPLHYAAASGNKDVVQMLLNQGDVDINSKENDEGEEEEDEEMAGVRQKRTPLQIAIYHGHLDVIRLLLDQKGIEINSRDFLGDTALSYAAEFSNLTVAEMLLKRTDIEVDSIDNHRDTPLSYTVKSCRTRAHLDIISMLVRHKDVNRYQALSNQQELLQYAVINGNETVVQWLLERGDVDIHKQATDGSTALSLAREGGCEALIALLSGHKNGEVRLEVMKCTVAEFQAQQDEFSEMKRWLHVLGAAIGQMGNPE